MDDRELTKEVFKKVQSCLRCLVGGSRHVAAYTMSEDTFRIRKIRERADGSHRYYFHAQASYESEFTVYKKTSGRSSKI